MPRPVNRENWRARGLVLLPYLWLVIFFLAPFFIVFKISLSQTALAQPPYTPVFDLAAGWSGLRSFFAGLSVLVFPGRDRLRSIWSCGSDSSEQR